MRMNSTNIAEEKHDNQSVVQVQRFLVASALYPYINLLFIENQNLQAPVVAERLARELPQEQFFSPAKIDIFFPIGENINSRFSCFLT